MGDSHPALSQTQQQAINDFWKRLPKVPHDLTRGAAYDAAWEVKANAANVEDRQAAWELINLDHYEAHAKKNSTLTCPCVDAAHTMTADEHSSL